MATGAGPVVPAWVKDAWEELRLKYLAALRMEKAYEKFSDPATYDLLYKDLIIEATQDIDGAAGGVISSVEQALQALGPADQDGSNWLAAKTSWRKFGLITGYNMQHQRPSVLEKPEAMTKWQEFWNSKAAGDIATTLKLIQSPVYFTNVPGSAEPGSQEEGMDARPWEERGRFLGGPINDESEAAFYKWLNDQAGSGRRREFGSNLGTHEQYVAKRTSGEGALPNNAFFKFKSTLTSDQISNFPDSGAGDPGPNFYDAQITIDNFFSDASSAKTDATTGHFLSPELVFYALTDTTAKNLEAPGEALQQLRQALQDYASNILTPNPRLEINKEKWGMPNSGPIDGATWYQWQSSGEYFNRPRLASGSRYSNTQRTPTPAACVVWPTLPLSGVSDDPSLNLSVKRLWNTLFTRFENGELLKEFDAYMRTQLEAEALKQGTKDSDEYVKWMEEGIEDILDFFGAGRIGEPVPIQERGAGETGQQIALDALTREAKEKILRFRNLKPFDFQCFLVENIALLADWQDRTAVYDNIMRLGSGEPGIDPGTTISVLNARGKEAQVRSLLNLTPAVYALLTPYIKIYRVWYDKKNGTVPVSQDEMPLPNYIPKTDIDRLTGKGGGRYGGWGLQSFNWNLIGTQPAAVDNNITATLTFYFQTLQDFFQGAQAAGGTVPKPIDLLISAPAMTAGGKKSTPGGSLDEQPSACGDQVKNNINRDYKGQYFRIKVTAGWSTPPNFAQLMPEMKPWQIVQLQNALESTRTSLYLQQTRHHLNFNEDGSLVLSIDYTASLVGMLTSNRMDILGANTPELSAELDAIATQIKSLNRQEATIREQEEDSEGRRERLKPVAAAKKKYITRKKEIIGQDKIKKYKRFLQRLYGRNHNNENVKGASPKIYTLEVDPLELFKAPLHKLEEEERTKRAQEKMSSNAAERGFRISKASSGAPVPAGNIDLLALLDDENPTSAAKLKEQWDEKLEGSDALYIPYFYLGDLIDSIIANNPDISNNQGKFLMFLADVEVTDPLVYYSIANLSAVNCADNIDEVELISKLQSQGYMLDLDPKTDSALREIINIGSIPISLDLFSIWFKDHVVKEMRPTYYLMHFIKDICAQLISDSLRTGCFETNTINEIRFDTSPIHFHNKDENGKEWVAPKLPDRKGKSKTPGMIKVKTLASLMGNLKENNDVPYDPENTDQTRDCDVTQGLVLYSTDAKPGTRFGNYGDDLAAGIYHNYIGSPVGLVKKINFERMDQPYLRESKIQKHGELGAEQLRELYTVNIEMIGNNLYKNGQYFYVDPTLVGGTADMARLLGIGGYFMATDVSHTIGPQGYTVSMKGLQQGLAFKSSATKVAALPSEVSLDDNTSQEMVDQDARVTEQLREEAARNALGDLLGGELSDELLAEQIEFLSEGEGAAEYMETIREQQYVEDNPEEFDN